MLPADSITSTESDYCCRGALGIFLVEPLLSRLPVGEGGQGQVDGVDGVLVAAVDDRGDQTVLLLRGRPGVIGRDVEGADVHAVDDAGLGLLEVDGFLLAGDLDERGLLGDGNLRMLGDGDDDVGDGEIGHVFELSAKSWGAAILQRCPGTMSA